MDDIRVRQLCFIFLFILLCVLGIVLDTYTETTREGDFTVGLTLYSIAESFVDAINAGERPATFDSYAPVVLVSVQALVILLAFVAGITLWYSNINYCYTPIPYMLTAGILVLAPPSWFIYELSVQETLEIKVLGPAVYIQYIASVVGIVTALYAGVFPGSDENDAKVFSVESEALKTPLM